LGYRANVLLACRQQVMDHRDELIEICVVEAGKTFADAAAEVDKGIEGLAYAASVGSWLRSATTQNVSSGIDVVDARYPIGVVTTVSPFNFPVMIPLVQCAMAIACGNTVVAKPSEKVPSAFRLIAELMHRAGLPSGVLNVVNGGREVVESMIEHPSVAGLSFVGSTPVAKHLRIRGIENDKRVQAFGSGKNHMIVLPDAELDMAADAAVSAAFGAAGQRCMAISVVVAVGDIGDQLVTKIAQRIPDIVVGSTADAAVQLGPVISPESKQRIHGFIEGVESSGASLIIDGRLQDDQDGWLVGASLVDHVKPGMPVYDQEVFGPVLCVVRASTYKEAMDIVASHPLGNGAAIFTRDGGAAKRYADDIQAGMVGINVPIPVPPWSHSFGGWKASAFTDSKISGPESLNFHTRIKAIISRWPDPAESKVDLGFLKTDR
ncbi:CoA-acylating methylmalonate-semialdehyde dehydrogenase, partial [Porticoccaceae bacterium]|nr:CoA-acylating methylmalonate-semialdehyde dehydrogenase [Porticoccaceae bacterium]